MAHATMMGNGIPARGGEIPLSSFILLRHSDHEIPLRGFHAANMKSSSIFSSFFPEQRQAPAKLCQMQLSLLGPDPRKPARTCHCVTWWETEAPDHGITSMRGGRLGYWHLTRETNGSTYVRRAASSAVRAQPAASQQDVSPSLDTFHFISIKMSSGCCRTASQSALSLPGLKCLNLPCTVMQPQKPKRCCKVYKKIY